MRNGHVRGLEEKHILSCAFTPVKPEVADFVSIGSNLQDTSFSP
jgi:hypothetical protein